MKIAVAQLLSGVDPAANLARIEEAVGAAAAGGAELVLFPEAMMRAFGSPDVPPTLVEVAEPTDGAWARAVQSIAERHGVVVVVGMFTPGAVGPSGNPRIRNTLLAVGAGVEAAYDKIHLYDAFDFAESESVEAGTEPVTFTAGGLTFGLATCFDIRNPGLFQHYAKLGVDAILVAASWAGGHAKLLHWQTLITARALDATCYVVACNQADPRTAGVSTNDGEPTGIGYSAIIAPDGVPVVVAESASETIVGEIDPAQTRAMRTRIPLLGAPVFSA
ncbi:nitrilase-related carbon-nitrogen hydrolase [Leucobacter albus]|uniref:Nitrilase-related carbon-nitrogen hydrolase n=1 Tax=Leucobacter albus TaxID=272210 RepID=A0ABW3TPX9_9MICO